MRRSTTTSQTDAKRPTRPVRTTLPPPATETSPRGIGSTDVDRAADALLRAGTRPTVERVGAALGRGSPNTINPLLYAWWKRLAGRLDAGPAALHRLPEPVLLAAEGLCLQALDDARMRVTLEQGSKKTSLARERQDLEIRSHVLSIRENEISDRLKQSEGRVSKLEIEVESLVTMLRKEQASRASAERRLNELSDNVALRRGRATQPTAAAARKRKQQSLKQSRTSARTKSAAKRKATPSSRRSRR